MGLNLKERSSGQHQGQLKITKRGPSAARRWLYFAALRHAQSGPIRPWFEAKKKKDKDRGLGAIVAIMRKLALAVHATVTNDQPFQLDRLLPGQPRRNKLTELNKEALSQEDIKPEGLQKKVIKRKDTKEESLTQEVSPPLRAPKLRLPLRSLSLPHPTSSCRQAQDVPEPAESSNTDSPLKGAFRTPTGVSRHLTARLDQIFHVANSMVGPPAETFQAKA